MEWVIRISKYEAYWYGFENCWGGNFNGERLILIEALERWLNG